MPDPKHDEDVQAEPSETAAEQHAPEPEGGQPDNRIGHPYEGLVKQAAEERPYVPGETTIIGQAEGEGAPISGVPTDQPDQQPAEEDTEQPTE